MTEMLGKYELLGHIATGGMAEIQLARQRGLQGFSKLVVIKRLLPSLAKDPDVVKLFLNEARIAARLNHSNVVQLYDLGRFQDSYYIAMEYIQGVDLRMILKCCRQRRQQLPLEHVLFIAKQVCEGLHHAHSLCGANNRPLNIVHCDVSPHNTLVSFDGMVKIVDFGIARASARLEKTTPGMVFGKYNYMSPEQFQGEPLDARSDIFSLGIMLWELCTARPLFRFSSLDQAKRIILRGNVASVRQYNYQTSPQLSAVIKRALELNPNCRYQTALQMGMDLEQEMRRLGLESNTLQLGRLMRQMFPDKLAELHRIEIAQAQADNLRPNWTEAETAMESSSPQSWMIGHKLEENPPGRGGLKVARNFAILRDSPIPNQIRIRSHSPRVVRRTKRSGWIWLMGVVVLVVFLLVGSFGGSYFPQIETMVQHIKSLMIVKNVQIPGQSQSDLTPTKALRRNKTTNTRATLQDKKVDAE